MLGAENVQEAVEQVTVLGEGLASLGLTPASSTQMLTNVLGFMGSVLNAAQGKCSGNIQRLTPKQFRELGLLQEINRQFLHPRGMALEVIVCEQPELQVFGAVWDSREDPEGFVYAGEILPTEDKAEHAKKLQDDHAEVRQERFGWVVQPFGDAGKIDE